MSIVLFLALSISSNTHASTIWNLKKMDSDLKLEKDYVFLKKNVSEETLVDHPLFKVMIPKGWSAGQGTEGDAETFQISPMQDIADADVNITLARRSVRQTKTLTAIVAGLKKNGQLEVQLTNINGRKWVSWKSKIEQPDKHVPVQNFKTILNSNEWAILVFAFGPSGKSSNKQIESVVNSIQLK